MVARLRTIIVIQIFSDGLQKMDKKWIPRLKQTAAIHLYAIGARKCLSRRYKAVEHNCGYYKITAYSGLHSQYDHISILHDRPYKSSGVGLSCNQPRWYKMEIEDESLSPTPWTT